MPRTKNDNIKDISDMMNQLIKKAQAERAQIEAAITQTEADLAKAQARFAEAEDRLEIQAAQDAAVDITKHKTALDIYRKKLDKLKAAALVPMDESDSIVDQILQDEENARTAFLSAVREPLAQIDRLVKEYKGTIKFDEDMLHKWHANVCPAHKAFDPTYGRKKRPGCAQITQISTLCQGRDIREFLENGSIRMV